MIKLVVTAASVVVGEVGGGITAAATTLMQGSRKDWIDDVVGIFAGHRLGLRDVDIREDSDD